MIGISDSENITSDECTDEATLRAISDNSHRDASEIQFPFVCKRRRVLLRHAWLISPRTLP